MMYSVNIYIYIYIVIGSQPVAQMLRIHTQSQMEGGHTFSPLSFCSIGIQATKAFQMPATANVYGSRGIHLPRSTQADHSRHVCGNEFTCSAHGCFKGTSQQESVGNSHSQNTKISRVFVLCFLL